MILISEGSRLWRKLGIDPFGRYGHPYCRDGKRHNLQGGCVQCYTAGETGTNCPEPTEPTTGCFNGRSPIGQDAAAGTGRCFELTASFCPHQTPVSIKPSIRRSIFPPSADVKVGEKSSHASSSTRIQPLMKYDHHAVLLLYLDLQHPVSRHLLHSPGSPST